MLGLLVLLLMERERDRDDYLNLVTVLLGVFKLECFRGVLGYFTNIFFVNK